MSFTPMLIYLVAKDLLAHEQVAEQIAVVVIVRETQILDISEALPERENPRPKMNLRNDAAA